MAKTALQPENISEKERKNLWESQLSNIHNSERETFTVHTIRKSGKKASPKFSWYPTLAWKEKREARTGQQIIKQTATKKKEEVGEFVQGSKDTN